MSCYPPLHRFFDIDPRIFFFIEYTPVHLAHAFYLSLCGILFSHVTLLSSLPSSGNEPVPCLDQKCRIERDISVFELDLILLAIPVFCVSCHSNSFINGHLLEFHHVVF